MARQGARRRAAGTRGVGRAVESLELRRLLTTIYVDANSPAGAAADGTSWAAAYADLQAALGVAAGGDEIRVADGVYRPTAANDRLASFTLKNGVGVYGGYAGYGAADPDGRDVAGDVTVLSGDIGTAGVVTDNAYNVVFGEGVDETAVLDGFTVTGGNANVTSETPRTSRGGGLYARNGVPTVAGCRFTGNVALAGGAIYCLQTAPAPQTPNLPVSNTSFEQNSATLGVGGAIYGNVAAANSSFTGNSAKPPPFATDAGGGAIWGRAALDGCTFTNNSVTLAGGSGGGGAVFNASAATVTGCTFSGNSVTAAGATDAGGGAVYNRASNVSGTIPVTVTFTNCTFSNNTLTVPTAGPNGSGGGAFFSYPNGSPVLNGCAFTGNVATITHSSGSARPSGGGALYVAGRGANLTSCTFDGNAVSITHMNSSSSGGGGGALYFYNSGSSTVTGCTFTGNAANIASPGYYTGGGGGAVYNYGGGTPFTACTFTRNVAYVRSGLSSSSPTPPIGGGGAMYNVSAAKPVITRSAFNGNLADVITLSTAAPPASGGGGGAIVTADSSSPNISNSTFAGNRADFGGAIFTDIANQSVVTNCTFAGNVAGEGGAVYALTQTSFGYAPAFRNSIFWGNSSLVGIEIATSAVYVSVIYSITQDGYGGLGNLHSDPMFERSPGPGPDFGWGSADDDYGDLRPAAGSIAIDTGDNASVTSSVSTPGDFNGNPRIQDTPGLPVPSASGAVVDMGAYESSMAANVSKANAGGPYVVLQGQSITLRGGANGSLVEGSPPTAAGPFAWDLDGNGTFETVGQFPTFNATSRPGTFTVTLRARFKDQTTATDTATITVVPATIYVDATSDAGATADGTSWPKAYPTLSAALARAVAGQTIKVAGGTYKPTTSADRFATFALKSGVTILGGYKEHQPAGGDYRDPATYPTIFSGEIGAADTTEDNSFHVVTARETDATAVLDAVTITLGNAYRVAPAVNRGGGMYVNRASPTVTDVLFLRNSAWFSGAGLAVVGDSANPTVSRSRFYGNVAGVRGGAVSVHDTANPSFVNTAFVGNAIRTSGGPNGTAIQHDGLGTVSLVNCSLTSNANVQVFVTLPQVYLGSTDSKLVVVSSLLGSVGGNLGGAQTSYSHTNLSGPGNLVGTLNFIRNASRGVDGLWGTADDDYGDVRPKVGSVLIDAGSNPGVPAGVTTDLGGNVRVIDAVGVRDPGAVVDIGAYEAGVVVLGMEYVEANGKRAVEVRFSTDVSASLAPSDLQIGKAGDGGVTPTILQYDHQTNVGTFVLAPDQLATGVYSILLDRLLVTDAGGTPPAESASLGVAVVRVGTTLTLAADATVQQFLFQTGGKLDLAGHTLAVGYAPGSSPAQQLFDLVRAGSNGGRWDGVVGIVSSDAAADAERLKGVAVFDDGQAVLVRSTPYGDTNADGRISADDVAMVLLGYAGASPMTPGWQRGDFNYDGRVSPDDFSLLHRGIAFAPPPAAASASARTAGFSAETIALNDAETSDLLA